MIPRQVLKRIIPLGMVVIMMFAATKGSLAAGESGEWSDMPTITLRLPGKTDPRWKETCGHEKGSCKTVIDKKNHTDCNNKYITLSIPDMEKYYGDVGPGLALGYRACQIAFANLYPGEIPPRGDQFVVTGLSSCPADPISFITGVRYGNESKGMFNGNLVIDEKIELFSFIFASMSSGKAVKLTCRYRLPQEFLDLMTQKKHDPVAFEKFWDLAHCLSRYILTAPAHEIYEVTPLPGFSWKQYKK
jgi:formylmethanofuran dehydrogenase subunit E